MKPGLILVCDAQPLLARELATRMFDALPGAAKVRPVQLSDATWAAIAIPPPAHEATCGSYAIETDRDVLIWSGEIFAPDAWLAGEHGSSRIERTSLAVLRRLRTTGAAATAECDGGFCGAWLDRASETWTIFNDRMGQLPVFWAQDSRRFIASPQVWLTARGLGAPLTIDEAGVADLVRTQNMTGERTLIAGVRWLPRGCAITRDTRGARARRTWDFDYSGPQIGDAREAIEQYVTCLETSIRRHTQSDSPLLLGISGGLDSRLFLAACERNGRVPHTFTAGWAFYEDVRFGRTLARLAGARHDFAELSEAGFIEQLQQAIIDSDGLQSAAHLAPVVTARAYLKTRPGSVLLEGFFHGLVGGGTVPADDDVSDTRPAWESHWARHSLHSGGSFTMVNGLLRPDLAQSSFEAWQSSIDDTFRAAPFTDPLHRAEYTLVHGRTGRVDVIGTALSRHDVLIRNPAADAAMLAWHQRVSPRLRRARALYAQALREVYPKYARVPRADNCGGLPISQNRWLREYCWQKARVYRHYANLRYSTARRWGQSSSALRAWTFDVWRREEGFEHLLRGQDARIAQWVRPDVVTRLWESAGADATAAAALLTLGTIETAVRFFETTPALGARLGESLSVPASTPRSSVSSHMLQGSCTWADCT